MRFELLTLFPTFFRTPLETSLIGKAVAERRIVVNIHDLRNWARDKHRTVDDAPYGGGPGMVLKPEPIVAAVESIGRDLGKLRRIYLSPQGVPLRQGRLADYLKYDALLLLCGRYEGVDQRAIDLVIDEEVSVGDYVRNGGEAAPLVFMETLARLVPGVLGAEASLVRESFQPILEHPQYTRPEDFRGKPVPEVLLSGDHKKIEAWRQEQALEVTKKRRPDLLK